MIQIRNHKIEGCHVDIILLSVKQILGHIIHKEKIPYHHCVVEVVVLVPFGRKEGFCEKLKRLFVVDIIVISRSGHETDSRSDGLDVFKHRKVLFSDKVISQIA